MQKITSLISQLQIQKKQNSTGKSADIKQKYIQNDCACVTMQLENKSASIIVQYDCKPGQWRSSSEKLQKRNSRSNFLEQKFSILIGPIF